LYYQDKTRTYPRKKNKNTQTLVEKNHGFRKKN